MMKNISTLLLSFLGLIWGLLLKLPSFGRQVNYYFNKITPKGLYARSLIIVMMPTFVLLSVTTYIFLERHWKLVTEQVAKATARDVAALVELHEKKEIPFSSLKTIAQQKLFIELDLLPSQNFPPSSRPFFDPLDANLMVELAGTLNKSFFVDSVGRSGWIEIRVPVKDGTLFLLTRRGHSYASSSFIFLAWLLGTSLLVLTISLIFLRNQIRPILKLAAAAQDFGKGRALDDFRPRGAREVRAAALAFMEMKRRIERQIDQRTTMLAGVSHDLRTVLTRFKLEIALMKDTPEKQDLLRDVNEMGKMLEAYLAFARGEDGEVPALTNIPDFLNDLQKDAERTGHKQVSVTYHGEAFVMVKPHAFKRALHNLIENAARFASTIRITGERDARYLLLHIEDDGPGIPEESYEDVFRPFLRLDHARNQNETSTGLGLAICRDIVRGHGGDVTLSKSELGGLKASVKVPL